MERVSVRLTEMCWPVFEFVTNFDRQVRHGVTPGPDQLRFDALAALRDAEDLARNDPVTERAWDDKVKAMMVYLLDYRLLNTDWPGSEYCSSNPFETDPNVLNHSQSLGGSEFFRDCDDVKREFELAERRERRDKDELAGLLNLYFTCLRLGFKGQFHDQPIQLTDYTRQLFNRLPAYSTTRAKELFPETYKHTQEVKANYDLGMNLTIVGVIFVSVFVASVVTFKLAWGSAVGELRQSAQTVEQVVGVTGDSDGSLPAPSEVDGDSENSSDS
jgi:type VI protein secretion system component VasF